MLSINEQQSALCEKERRIFTNIQLQNLPVQIIMLNSYVFTGKTDTGSDNNWQPETIRRINLG